MEASKKSPKYNKKDAERMPAMIKRMMGMMKIKLSEKEMIYLRGTRQMKAPFTIKSADKKSVTVVIKQGEQQITVIFTLLDKKYMNFKSSGSDDMDYYVWKKVKD